MQLTNVLIDGYYLDSARGMGRAIREMASALADNEPQIQITFLVPQGSRRTILADSIRYVEAPHFSFPVWEQLIVPYYCLKLSPHVVHSPYNTLPLLHFWKKSQVITIHDLIFLDRISWKEGLVPRIGRTYRNFVCRCIRFSKAYVTTLTLFTQANIACRLGVSSRIHQTPISAFAGGPSEEVERPKGPYLLHVGGTAPHKNTQATIEAFRCARADGFSLVVVGVSQADALARAYASPMIVFPGTVTDGQMRFLYNHATAVLFPSRAEGYGLPILEGMALGCPVITSNIPPMTEIAGDAALFVEPNDIGSITSAIGRICSDEDLRRKLSRRGSERVKLFTAKGAARSLADIYETAAGS